MISVRCHRCCLQEWGDLVARVIYTQEVHDFIKENVVGITTKDLAEMVNERFGTDFTEEKMKCYKANHKLRSGTRCGIEKGLPTERYPQEVRDFVLQNHVGVGPKGMTELLNKTFGTNYTLAQMKGYYNRNNLNSGLTGRFEKGHIPANKGMKGCACAPGSEKGWFKKGGEPMNKTDIGTIRLRKPDNYLWEKYGPGPHDWKPHHQLVWERAHGKQPEGYVIIFKDGNKMNCDISNLQLISKNENAIMNARKLRTSDATLTEGGILVAKLHLKKKEKLKKQKENDEHGNSK